MQPKSFIIFLLVLGFNLLSYSQARIKGQVISSQTKQPIAEVSVSVQGKSIGTVTNDEGKFSLVAPMDKTDSLAIEFLGYKSQKIAFSNTNQLKSLVIQLDTLVQQLTEVTVRPLSLRQLLDSITTHNQSAFLGPMKVNGYYREFVFTNNKCTEYSDALTSFFKGTNKSSYDGQLKIFASRCAEAKEDNNKDNTSAKEFYVDSKVPPNKLFQYAMLDGLFDKYLPSDALKLYEYSMESIANSSDIVITVMPKPSNTKNFYRFTFILAEDFGIKSYLLEIDPKRMNNLPERSLLGIHVKLVKQYLEVKYERNGDKIHPQFFKYDVTMHIGGKFFGTALNQTYNPKSEYVTTDINNIDLKPFSRSETYKKGNLCDNGPAINDALLKAHNFITPTRKDSLAISSMR